MATSAAIIGASGYGAREVMALLARHPNARLAVATSRETERPLVADLHPVLRGRVDLRCEPFDPDAVAARAQCAFLALPHGAAAAAAAPLLARGVRVIDLSADYRLRDPAVYAEWYHQEHPDVANLSHAVYGLCELYGAKIPDARLVANPGCYPTSAALGLAPLLAEGLIDRQGVIIDSKSGVSGAGRSPKLSHHFPECNESVSAYNLGTHRHTPEIEQTLTDVAGEAISVLFAPHLIPMDRGILSTIYARPARPIDENRLVEAFRRFYDGKPFVRLAAALPATKDVAGTNFCDIAVRVRRGTVVVVSCLDNLIKGAAGAAVQNFNLMFGYPETTSLL
jgi:N-acetyl-gamma-glutamyl-phosphate reductase